tara:strand:+ start:7389 stop:7862 length:474 start_codon:yes stop_codon:yes gene_type:complete
MKKLLLLNSLFMLVNVSSVKSSENHHYFFMGMAAGVAGSLFCDFADSCTKDTRLKKLSAVTELSFIDPIRANSDLLLDVHYEGREHVGKELARCFDLLEIARKRSDIYLSSGKEKDLDKVEESFDKARSCFEQRSDWSVMLRQYVQMLQREKEQENK